MKQALIDNDWIGLQSAAHKIVPSFSIMGMSVDFENMARKVQEFAINQQHSNETHDLVMELDAICSKACAELQDEFNIIKSTSYEDGK